MSKNIAVILSGSGHLDGAEIRESVITLLCLDELGINYKIFAPDYDQHHTINHLSQTEMPEKRNILCEAARIARGDINPLNTLNVSDFDALAIPGGFGVAKNFCSIAFKGVNAEINKDISEIIHNFHNSNKKIGAICISPALVALAFKGKKNITLTLGDENQDNRGLIEGLCSTYKATNPGSICIDNVNMIASCAAYMRLSKLNIIHQEIKQVVSYLND